LIYTRAQNEENPVNTWTSTTTTFIRDCLARALMTLPWASISDEWNPQPLHKMQEIIRKPSCLSGELRYVADTFKVEIAANQDADNFIKAGVLRDFLKNLMETYK